MRPWLLLSLLALFTACAPQLTDVPTLATPAHYTPTVEYPSRFTPTPTETPTPEPITLTGTFGLEPEVAAKFAGAERYIRRTENGTYLVTAFYRDPQTKKLTPLELELLPDTFSDHPEIKNPLAPLTVIGRLKADPSQPRFSIISSAPAPTETPTTPTPTHHSDQEDFLEYILPPKNTNFLLDDQDFWPKAEERVPSIEEMPIYGPLHEDYKLIWTGKEFRLAYTFPALFEGVGTENPRLLQENLEKIPFIPIEDIQSGLAAQSVLLAMQEDGYRPFTEEVIQWYKQLGGSSLLFVQNPDSSKIVWLKPKANDKGLKNNYFNSAEMFTPYWFRTKIGEQIYDIASIAWFDPLDAQNPKTGEFKILFGIPFTTYPMSAAEMTRAYATRQTLLPMWFQIYGENLNPNDPKQSLLAQLLSIEGNDASKLGQNTGYVNIQVNIDHGMQHLPELKIIETQPFSRPFPPQLQKMIFLFEVGVAQ